MPATISAAPAVERMRVDPEPAEMIDGKRHQNIGSDGQAGKRSRAVDRLSAVILLSSYLDSLGCNQ